MTIAARRMSYWPLHFRFYRGLNTANEKLPAEPEKLEAADTQVLGVSMDSPFANKAFADQIGVTLPPVERLGRRNHASLRHLR